MDFHSYTIITAASSVNLLLIMEGNIFKQLGQSKKAIPSALIDVMCQFNEHGQRGNSSTAAFLIFGE